MKFSVDAKAFKTIVERIFAAVPNKAAVADLTEVGIEAANNTVTVSSYDGDCACRISAYALVIEPGEIHVQKDNLKKVYAIKGDNLMIESDINTITVNSGKKKSKVCADSNYSLATPDFDYKPENIMLVMDSKKLNEVLCNIAIFTNRTLSSAKEIMTAINFDANIRKIAGLDGHRIGFFYAEDYFCGEKSNKVNVPNFSAVHLKKILPKNDSKVSVYVDKKFVKFVGEDFTYVTRQIDGEYFNYMKLIGDDFEEFSINRDEMIEASKEYKKAISANAKKPMYFRYDAEYNRVVTGIVLGDYMTSDTIEIADADTIKANYKNGFVKGFNPEFINDAFGIMKADRNGMVTLGIVDGTTRTPISIKDDEYLALVLPVNISGMEKDTFEGFTAA